MPKYTKKLLYIYLKPLNPYSPSHLEYFYGFLHAFLKGIGRILEKKSFLAGRIDQREHIDL